MSATNAKSPRSPGIRLKPGGPRRESVNAKSTEVATLKGHAKDSIVRTAFISINENANLKKGSVQRYVRPSVLVLVMLFLLTLSLSPKIV
jgi:hypothetical protein